MEMNSADWAITPGARKSRYGTSPVGIARSRVNVVPKMTSHRVGCTARVISSVRSRRIFCSSTRHIVATRDSTMRTGASQSTQPRSGTASLLDIAEPSRLVVVTGERPEHVVEVAGTVAAQAGHQVAGRPDGADAAAVHERHPV